MNAILATFCSSQVDSLKSVDNFWVVVGEYTEFCKDEVGMAFCINTRQILCGCYPSQGSVLERLKVLPHDDQLPQWESALRVWQHYQTIVLPTKHSSSSDDIASAPQSTCRPNSGGPTTFRVTCSRGGRKHVFTSNEAAAHLGAGLIQRFGWKVKMKEADLEVLLKISGTVSWWSS